MTLSNDPVTDAIDEATARKKAEGKDSKFHYHTADEINDELEEDVGDSEVEEFLEQNPDYFSRDRDNKQIRKYRNKLLR